MPTLTPERIFLTINAYQQSIALKTAVGLDLFTGIGEGHSTPAALASRTGAAERGLRILCDFLVIGGLLSKDNHHYGLTPESAAFLDRRIDDGVDGRRGIRLRRRPVDLGRRPGERIEPAPRRRGKGQPRCATTRQPEAILPRGHRRGE